MGLESHSLDGSLRGLQSQYRYAYTQNTFTFLSLVFRSSGMIDSILVVMFTLQYTLVRYADESESHRSRL